MRLQFHSGYMYDMRRAIAVSNLRNADFDLIDGDGTVMQSFNLTVTMEPDETAYQAAMNPPMDEATRRFNESPARPTNPSDRRARIEGMKVTSKAMYRTGYIDAVGMLPGVRAFRAGIPDRVKPPTREQSARWRAAHAAEVKAEQPRAAGNVLMW